MQQLGKTPVHGRLKPSCWSLLTILTTALILGLNLASAHADSVAKQQYQVRGLAKPAEILVDEWGVPHLYAQTHYDTFFVQGFNAARDRLWQIDLWRKRGLGELAASLGADYIEQDAAARLFLYRGDMYREWLSYASDAKKITQHFAAGINAYVRLTEANPALLPPEFVALNYRPALWQADDVVRIRSNGLWRNLDTEVRRAQIACAKDLQLAAIWKVLEPGWTTKIPQGLDPCLIPDEVLDTYHLAKAPVLFKQAKSTDLVQSSITAGQERSARWELGSNNWVVAGSRTNTGRPILADDPHRGHAVPSLRYIAHLVGPDLNVIGAGEPGLPGISIGHNEHIAFGLTIFPIDQEDLYVYQKTAQGYRYQNRSEPFQTHLENIAVRNGPDQQRSLKFTRHGPVIFETETLVFAARIAWLEPGMSPYFGSVEYMRAGNWREFVGALNRWGAPSENQVYADTLGNIGYKPAGLFPKRPNWDGLLPVPGDGRYEWDGFFDMDSLPVEYNPQRGFTGTANSMNLPADYPIDKYPIGFEWSAPWRYKRLWEVLATQPKHSIKDSLALQRDYHSVLARQVLDKIRPDFNQWTNSPLDADLVTIIEQLTQWDATLSPSSAAAAIYTIWYNRHLEPQLAKQLHPSDPAMVTPLDSYTVLAQLDSKVGKSIARKSLERALIDAKALLGPDVKKWQWGTLHQIKFTHPLIRSHFPGLADTFGMQAYPRGGSGNTTNNTYFKPEDFLVRSGASFRMVLDVGNWDAAWMTNAPGQSGHPDSPFYDNLLEGWATEKQFPLLYTRSAIEKHLQQKIDLIPESSAKN